jgi:hypothetical protein
MKRSISLAFREVGGLINRPMTVRTEPRFRHSHHRPHRLLLLSATTELQVINLVPQHDPHPDPQLACHGHTCFAQTFLHQFAAVETLEFRIAADCMRSRFSPEKPQQWTALFGDPTEPLLSSTGVFPRDDPHITGQGLAVGEAPRISQEHFRCKRRDWPQRWTVWILWVFRKPLPISRAKSLN